MTRHARIGVVLTSAVLSAAGTPAAWAAPGGEFAAESTAKGENGQIAQPDEEPPPEPSRYASLPPLTMNAAVSIALARNRSIIAAKLDIRAAELDEIEAGLYPNPVLSYNAGNLVLGAGNDQNAPPRYPGFFGQPVHTIGVSEIIDVWAKRSARMRAAAEGTKFRRLVVADALRRIVHDVRAAFADVVRSSSEWDLARETQDRYAETVRLSRVRFAAGEISDADLGKIELEGLRYASNAIDTAQTYDLARQRLAALLGLGTDLPYRASFPVPEGVPVSVGTWTRQALATRPDLLAARAAERYADALLTSQKRETLPDLTVGVSYTHSAFTASGDNPNTLGLGASVPLPIFDRNQAGIGRAELAGERARNELSRLALEVRVDVADAARRVARAKALLAVYEGGGMLSRAATALHVAGNSYKAGAISLLELLEARRTYIETRGSYLSAQNDYRQSVVDLYLAIGGEPK